MIKKEILKESRIKLSPWVTLIERTIKQDDGDAIYHSFDQSDYISIVAVNGNEEMLLVEQYRPAVDKITLELPGGLLDSGENPETCARRELTEETGYEVVDQVFSLGSFCPDTGRLSNRLHGFYTHDIKPVDTWRAESGVNLRAIPIKDIMPMIHEGVIDHALHIALICLVISNYFVQK